MSELVVYRDIAGPAATLSRWSLDGVRVCFGLEDAVRPIKIPGQTCIPPGNYKLRLRTRGDFHLSYAADPRFADIHRGMIELVEVPGFSDILIHCGNNRGDTRGCLLPGMVRDRKHWVVTESAIAYRLLYRRLVDAVEDGRAMISVVEGEQAAKRRQIVQQRRAA